MPRSDLLRLLVLFLLAGFQSAFYGYFYPLVDVPQSTLQEEEQPICVGWRATAGCKHTQRQPLWDLGCDRPIPKGASGYCELLAPNGTLIRTLHKSSCSGHRKSKRVTCNMAREFLGYKREARAYREEEPEPVVQPKKPRGIVMAVYQDVLVSAYAVIQLLRHQHNCSLPVELWSRPNEIDPNGKIVQELKKDHLVAFRTIDDPSIAGFLTKPYSVYYSSFDQVLLLDADSIPVTDPHYLFETPEFQQHGAYFFLDYWSPDNTVFEMNSYSLLWELLGLEFVEEFEQESGQLLIDKPNSKAALHQLMFLSRTFDRWLGPLRLAYGDKDLFRLAWRMSQTSFYYNPRPPGVAGFATPHHKVCGVTLVQQDPLGQPVFLHRNTVKVKQISDLKRVWNTSLAFVGDHALQQYRIQPSPLPGQKIKCYHPTPESLQWFQETDLQGSHIQAVEDAFLKWAKHAIEMSGG